MCIRDSPHQKQSKRQRVTVQNNTYAADKKLLSPSNNANKGCYAGYVRQTWRMEFLLCSRIYPARWAVKRLVYIRNCGLLDFAPSRPTLASLSMKRSIAADSCGKVPLQTQRSVRDCVKTKAPSTPATMSKQHCRTLQVERFFRHCRMLLRHCCRLRQQCRTKFRPFDKVETNWTCSICFDFVERTKFYDTRSTTLLPFVATKSDVASTKT